MRSTLGIGWIKRKVPSQSDYTRADQTRSYYTRADYTRADDAWRYKVDSLNDCIILNDYFSKFPPITYKTSTRYKHWTQVLYWLLQGPSVAEATGGAGRSPLGGNLHHIRELQRLNTLLT